MIFNLLKFSRIGHDIIKEMSNSDPFFRQFYLSYGRIFNPRNINTKEDINKELNKLVQEIHKMIEPSQGNPNFIENIPDKDIQNEIEAAQNIEGGREAIQVYNANPEKGKKFLLDLYNKDKKKVFDEWWNYITQNYKEYPAFQYIILISVFKDLKKTEKRTPQILNANAVAQTFEIIKNSNDKTAINIKKTYQTKLEEVNRNELNSSEKSNGVKPGTYWIKIPSKENDSENFENNKKKLQGYAQGMGWCTAGDSKADYYLKQGDLWILVVDGEIVVGMPMAGSNKIAEIDGYNNSVPYDYWEEIINFVKEKNFEKNERYFELEKNVAFNEKFEKGEFIDINLKVYRVLSKVNKSRLTEEQYTLILNDIEYKLNDDSYYITEFPKDLIDKFGIDNYIDWWNKCINDYPDLIIYFPKDLIDKVGIDNYINWWNNCSEEKPNYVTKFPKDVIDKVGIDNYINLWNICLDGNPGNIISFPEDVIDKVGIDNYINWWNKCLNINTHIITRFPKDVIDKVGIDNYINLWNNCLNKYPKYIIDFPKDVIDKVGIDNYINWWNNLLKDNPKYIIDFPKDLIDNLGIDNYINWWNNCPNEFPTHVMNFPPDLIDKYNLKRNKTSPHIARNNIEVVPETVDQKQEEVLAHVKLVNWYRYSKVNKI